MRDLSMVILRWCCWTPVRAAVSLIAAVSLVVAVISAVSPHGSHHPPTAGVDITTSAVSDTSTEAGGPTPMVTSSTPASAPPAPPAVVQPVNAEAVTVSSAFTRAWIGPSPKTIWLRNLAEWSTPRLAQLMATGDPSMVPASRMTGLPQQTAAADGRLLFTVPTDSPYPVTEQLVQVGGHWRVDSVTVTKG